VAQTFADQAVIAIENASLLRELQARDKELAEARAQQAATGDILKVISSSRTDVHLVFDTIIRDAVRLCEAAFGVVILFDGKMMVIAGHHNLTPEGEAMLRRAYPQPLSPDNHGAQAILERKVINIADVHESGYSEAVKARAHVLGYRAFLGVPLMRDGEPIGVICVTRLSTGTFPDSHVALLCTFADQAVIAIDNARLFNEIHEKSRQLEAANKHKSEFLANMSHELRTPLNAIIGFSEALLERLFGDLNDKQAEYLRDICESGRHQLSLINDILDLSKIEAGRMELEMSKFHVPTALSNAMTLVRDRARRHGIGLSLDVDPQLAEVEADERKFKQIMLNLLSNAVKFTPDGGLIEVRARRNADSLEIAVRDTGIGIAPDEQMAAFEEFRQIARGSANKVEGTGLGLALTRRFVALHGGDIRLESALGSGSTFIVTLPLSR
jgi:K+-sensing histidine kinase KdpD